MSGVAGLPLAQRWRKPRSSRFLAWVLLLAGTAVAVVAVVAGGRGQGAVIAWIVAGEGLLVAGCAYALGLRPSLGADETAIRVRNYVRTYVIAWRDFTAVVINANGLNIRTRYGQVRVAAVPHARSTVDGRHREEQVASELTAFAATALGTPYPGQFVQPVYPDQVAWPAPAMGGTGFDRPAVVTIDGRISPLVVVGPVVLGLVGLGSPFLQSEPHHHLTGFLVGAGYWVALALIALGYQRVTRPRRRREGRAADPSAWLSTSARAVRTDAGWIPDERVNGRLRIEPRGVEFQRRTGGPALTAAWSSVASVSLRRHPLLPWLGIVQVAFVDGRAQRWRVSDFSLEAEALRPHVSAPDPRTDDPGVRMPGRWA